MSEDLHSLIEGLLEFEQDELPETRDTYVRSAFAYPGNKFNSLQYIIPKLPKGDRFIEVCGGSGVVTLNLKHTYLLKVFNDRCSGVTAFFRCMKDPAKVEGIKRWIDLSVHSREEFIWCRDSWMNPQDDVERAARWYYMIRTSFASLGRNWARSTSARAQTGKALQNGLDLFDAVHRGFQNVQVENQDACQCIRDYCGTGSVFYLDPDYWGTDSGIYEHKVQHKTMLDLIFDSRGWFAVSSYKNDLYESYTWDERYEWPVNVTLRAKAFTENNNLKGKENVHSKMDTATEVLYIKDNS